MVSGRSTYDNRIYLWSIIYILLETPGAYHHVQNGRGILLWQIGTTEYIFNHRIYIHMSNCNTAEQNRRNGLIFNIPPPRYTPQNPYSEGWTKEQLDMRRKAEVLKYNKTANTRTTKTQSWLQIVRGVYQRRTYSGAYLSGINNADANCETVVTYSTGAGIPGPQIPLYLDPRVPLYNYNTQQQALGINNEEETDMWRTKYDTNLLSNMPNIFTINIRTPIDNTQYKYTLRTAIGLYLDGSSNALDYNVSVSFKQTSVKVLYGGALVSTSPTITLDSEFISDGGGNITKDISGSLLGGPYAGAIYLGNMTISNLLLPTAAGNTYDVVLEPVISIKGRIIVNDRAILYSNLIPFSNDPRILSNNTKKFTTNMTFATQQSSSIIELPSLTGQTP
jgi:hypothetical protein